jgi:ATP-dependent Clp protease adapter protein ClpS
MMHVHTRGHGVCGVYPFEIAETKVDLVHGGRGSTVSAEGESRAGVTHGRA